jgi:hypothetical protein
MKTFVSLLSALFLFACVAMAADGANGKLFHCVSFKFKEDVTDAQKTEIEKAFAALKTSIPQIVSLDYGTNVSKEKFDKGFTHMFVLTFANEADRDVYIAHPEHKKFGKLLGGKLAQDGVFVIDFLSK